MKYRVLGCSGGEAPGFRLSSFLLEDRLLIDTGSVSMALEVSEQAKIDHILLTHSHLDHTGGLPLVADNVFGMRDSPVQVHGIAPKKLSDVIGTRIDVLRNWISRKLPR